MRIGTLLTKKYGILYLLCGLTILNFVLLNGTIAAAKAKKVKIGIVGYLSGPALPWGLAQQQSGRIFINEINEQGGLLVGGEKHKFEIVAYDDKNPSGAVAAVNKMIFADGCKHIFGPCMSSGWVAIQKVTVPNKVFNMASGYTKIPRGPESPLTFSWCAGPYERYPAILNWMKKANPNVNKIVIIGPNDETGHTVVDGAKWAMPQLGYKFNVEYYERGTVDFYPLLTRVLAHKPDYIDFSGSSPNDQASMVKQVRELGFEGLLGTMASGMDEKGFVQIAGLKNAEGFISIGLCGEKFATPEYIEWVNNYTRTYGTWNAWAGESFVGFQCFKQAVLRADSLDPQEIAKQLEGGKDFDTLYGKVYFGGKQLYERDSQMTYDVAITRMTNGKNETVALVPPAIK